MSRSAGISAAVLLALAGTAALADCTPQVRAAPRDVGWDLMLLAPCAPYTAVTVEYGPLRLQEELGAYGSVSVTLPVLDAAVARKARVEGLGGALSVAPPAESMPGGFVWIEGRNDQPGLLPYGGFPDPDTGLVPELALFAPGGTPETLGIPVTEARCGHAMRFTLLRDGWSAPRDVVADLPDCALAGAVVPLPLDPH